MCFFRSISADSPAGWRVGWALLPRGLAHSASWVLLPALSSPACFWASSSSVPSSSAPPTTSPSAPTEIAGPTARCLSCQEGHEGLGAPAWLLPWHYSTNDLSHLHSWLPCPGALHSVNSWWRLSLSPIHFTSGMSLKAIIISPLIITGDAEASSLSAVTRTPAELSFWNTVLVSLPCLRGHPTAESKLWNVVEQALWVIHVVSDMYEGLGNLMVWVTESEGKGTGQLSRAAPRASPWHMCPPQVWPLCLLTVSCYQCCKQSFCHWRRHRPQSPHQWGGCYQDWYKNLVVLIPWNSRDLVTLCSPACPQRHIKEKAELGSS